MAIEQSSGKSVAEVAHLMAERILFSIEKKRWANLTRAEYLRAVYEAGEVLRGVEPAK